MFIGAIVGAVATGVVGVVGSALADDNGAEGANDAAAESTRLQSEIAREQWDRYKEVYAPLELSMVDDATKADRPEEFVRAAGDASATVSSQFGKARARLERTPGLDPSSGAYQAGMTNLALQQAATDATAQNSARAGVKDQAYKKKMAAIGLGKGLDQTAASGLANAASANLAMANAGQQNANAQAGAVGRVMDRVFSSPTTSNWLGNVGTAMRYGTNVGSQQTTMLQAQENGL